MRFRPRPEIGVRDIERMVTFSENIILSTEGSFDEVLGMADLLVSFSSTTIEEALQNRIPVLQYGGGGRYQHIPGLMVRRDLPVVPAAVYHIQEPKDLADGLRRILDQNTERQRDERLFRPYVYPDRDREALSLLFAGGGS